LLPNDRGGDEAENERDEVLTMGTLNDLPGKKGSYEATFAGSITQAMKLLGQGKTVTSAGDSGALNIYRDDGGKIRVGFYRYYAALSEEITGNQKRTREWLKKWWPRLEN
jgi:hypothetical protein